MRTIAPFCAARAAALSPLAVGGAHARLESPLTDAAIEAIHRIRTDPGRLGETWFLRLREAGLGEEAYVELVSVVAVVTAVDTFRHAAGLEPWALPSPRRRRSRHAIGRAVRVPAWAGSLPWRRKTSRRTTPISIASTPARASAMAPTSIAL